MARLLLAAGADVDKRGSRYQATPFGFACFFDQTAMIELLAPLTRDVWALASAARFDRVEALLREDPGLATARNPNGDTALHTLPPSDETAALEMAELLLRHGADARATNVKGETPGQVARLRGLDEVAEVIEGTT